MKTHKSAALRRLLKNAWQLDRGLFAVGGLYTLFALAVPLLSVLLPRLVVGHLQGPAPTQQGLLTIVVCFFVAGALCHFLREWLKDLGAPRITALRIDYVRDNAVKLIGMDYSHTEDAGFYERWERSLHATSSNDNGVEGIYHRLFDLPRLVLLVLGLSLFLGVLHPLITLGLLLHAAVSLLLAFRAQRYAYGRQQELSRQARRVDHFGSAASDFSYGKDLRLYALKDRLLNHYRMVIDRYMKVWGAIQNREYALGLLSLPLFLISDLLVYGLLARAVTGGMSMADFSMYLMAAITLSAQMSELSDNLSFIRQEYLYVSDFYRFMDTDLDGLRGSLSAPAEAQPLDIRFEQVSFRYPGTDKDVLRDFSLHIPAGQRLALVGINGAGKTTLVKLLCGLYAPQQGQILVNGQPTIQYGREALFSLFAPVFQDVNILAFTLAENVAGTSEGIDRQRVQQALEQAGLWDKVSSLPQGIDSMMLKVIEEDGVMLSGGEQQKLAIARALYKNAPCVIMDEPTAALDALAEKEIYQSFDTLTQGRTAIYISHRLASTQFCDKVAMLDHDGLQAYGTHEELMAQEGPYREMFRVQGRYYQQEVSA